MSEKCLYCSTPIEQKEGKRERKFCSPSHCTMYNLNLKKKDKPKGKQGRPKGSPNKNKPNVNDKVEADNRNNPLTNAARGRDESGVNEDEVKPPKKIVLSKDSAGAKVLTELSEKKKEREKKFQDKVKGETEEAAPTSLADMFKGRNINQRTYKHPKS